MVKVVVVDFQNSFDEQALYIDDKQIDRVDSYIWPKVLETLEDLGLITFEHRILDGEVADRFLGGSRYIKYEEYTEHERNTALEKAAELRKQAAALEEQAAALEKI